MLVLTRKIGETIRIGPDVTVRVLAVRGGQVRLGLSAPLNVRIVRDEVVRAAADRERTSEIDDTENATESPS